MHLEMIRAACLEPRLLAWMESKGLYYTRGYLLLPAIDSTDQILVEKNDVLLRSILFEKNIETDHGYAIIGSAGVPVIIGRPELLVRELKILLAGGLFQVSAAVILEYIKMKEPIASVDRAIIGSVIAANPSLLAIGE